MHKERNMKLNKKSGAKIHDVSGSARSGATLIGVAMAETVKGRCFGVNGCKGQGNCKSAKNDCKGKNGCKARVGSRCSRPTARTLAASGNPSRSPFASIAGSRT
jgi:hypothetical protein